MKYEYKPLFMKEQLYLGSGRTVIVTGWTLASAVKKRFDQLENGEQYYAAIGNLYSAQGVNFLVRNLLANGHVRHLVLIEATKQDENSGSIAALKLFLERGVVANDETNSSKAGWRITGTNTCLDPEISLAAIHELRRSTGWKVCRSIGEAVDSAKLYRDFNWGSPLRESVTFPYIPPAEAETMPGNIYGQVVRGKDAPETWLKLMKLIRSYGRVIPSAYSAKWQELIDVMAVIEPNTNKYLLPSWFPATTDFVEKYSAEMIDPSPDKGEGVKYTYGERMRSWFEIDQVAAVVNKLAVDLNSSRAVISLWDAVADNHIDNKTPPCLNQLWVRVKDNQLSMTAIFRSHDMFGAWPVNIMGLLELQQYILENLQAISPYSTKLQLQQGPLVVLSQSAHIYESSWEFVDELLVEEGRSIRPTYDDPVGNFVISVDEAGYIDVQRTTPAGEPVKTYSFLGAKNKAAAILSDMVLEDCPDIQPKHAAYLGAELYKAARAVKEGKHYIQDQELQEL